MKTNIKTTNEMAAEYDFSKGVRGKHYEKMKEGSTVSIYSPNKNVSNKRVIEKINYIRIDDDVNKFFKTSDEVNNALRAFINAIPKRTRKTKERV